jgi:hypothetical protein
MYLDIYFIGEGDFRGYAGDGRDNHCGEYIRIMSAQISKPPLFS